jgi:hypothetical protein
MIETLLIASASVPSLQDLGQLLQYGVYGLATIFAFLAFLLATKPRFTEHRLRALRYFLIFCIALMILCVAASIQHAERTTRLNSVIPNLAADQIESVLQETASKGHHYRGSLAEEDENIRMDDRELLYRRLRKGAFLYMYSFAADESVLTSAVQQIQARGEYPVAEHIPRLIAELPTMRADKLLWLRRTAIPALEADIEYLSTTAEQRNADAEVPLPKIAWILNHSTNNIPTVDVSNIALLRAEADLLKQIVR